MSRLAQQQLPSTHVACIVGENVPERYGGARTVFVAYTTA